MTTDQAQTEDIEWAGRVWRRWPDHPSRSRRVYYMSTTGGREYLHRAVYTSAHGVIPEGWHVHHVDHDPLNNAPDNLVALSPTAHSKHHAEIPHKVGRTCPQCGDTFVGKRPWAKWCSPACKMQWRRDAGLVKARTLSVKPTEHRDCLHCGGGYQVVKPWQRFCSPACKQRAARLAVSA